MLKERNIRNGFFEHNEFLALRNELPDYLQGFISFGYYTGWRFSEISGLTWKQVDMQKNIVRLDPGTTKNDCGRLLSLDGELKEVIQRQLDKRKGLKVISHYVFPNRTGTSQISDIRFSWDKACNKAGLGKRLFHDFRRTAVRNMVRAGVQEKVVMTITGHKTRSVFDRYNIINETDIINAAKTQENYLNSLKGTISGTITKIKEKRAIRNNG